MIAYDGRVDRRRPQVVLRPTAVATLVRVREVTRVYYPKIRVAFGIQSFYAVELIVLSI